MHFSFGYVYQGLSVPARECWVRVCPDSVGIINSYSNTKITNTMIALKNEFVFHVSFEKSCYLNVSR